MSQQDQNTNTEENTETAIVNTNESPYIHSPYDFLKPTHYNKQVLEILVLKFNLRTPEIRDLFDGKYTEEKIASDLKRFKISLKFIEARSVPDYYEAKIEYYNNLLAPYLDEAKNVTFRKLEKILTDFKDATKKINNDNYVDVDSDVLNENLLSIKEYIQIQQKDRDFVSKMNQLQDSLMSKLLDARQLEIEQLNIEDILNAIYDELCKIELELGKAPGELSTPFYIAIKKKINEITGTNRNIFDNKDLKDWVKTQLESNSSKPKEVKYTKKGKRKAVSPKHKEHAQKVQELMDRKKISHNLAQKVLKAQKLSPELTEDYLIMQCKKEMEETSKPKVEEVKVEPTNIIKPITEDEN